MQPLPIERISRLLFLAVMIMMAACRSTTPPVGTIEIDANLPVEDDQLLPVGITLESDGSTPRDLLSPNLLVNGGFDLAPIPKDCAYNSESGMLITPNGYHTFYPALERHYGWQVRGGASASVQFLTGANPNTGTFLRVVTPPRDSVSTVYLTNHLAPFTVKSGESYTFSCRIRCDGDLTITAGLTKDTTAQELSAGTRIAATEGWQRFTETIHTTLSDSCAVLTIKAVGRGAFDIDDVTVYRKDLGLKFALPDSLVKLIANLHADFLRFPGGRMSNGFFPGTYPVWRDYLDFVVHRPTLWTVTNHEYTGNFAINEFLHLAQALRTTPIYITNIGITDPEAFPRTESITDMTDRQEDLVQLAKHILNNYKPQNDSTQHLVPALQLGYNMSWQDYHRRFDIVTERFRKDSIPIDLISGADMTLTHRYSDYVFDNSGGTKINTPELTALLQTGYEETPWQRQPIMLGEMQFANTDSAEVYLPPFLLRAAFMINAENESANLRGITLGSLLGSKQSDSSSSPLILVDGNHFTPTPLYYMVKDFVKQRGEMLRVVTLSNSNKPIQGIRPIYASLTSTPDGRTFYLKVVNTTRHPLHYRLNVKGPDNPVTSISAISYLPDRPTTVQKPSELRHYKRVTKALNNPQQGKFFYTFAPYEFVIIKLTT